VGLAVSCDLPGTGRAVDEREVARLYRLGLTMAEIAGICQVPARAIATRLDRAGVARRARSQKAGLLPLDRTARRCRRQPYLLGELAAQLGISPEVIAARASKPPPLSRGAYRAEVRVEGAARLSRVTAARPAPRARTPLAAPGTTCRPPWLPSAPLAVSAAPVLAALDWAAGPSHPPLALRRALTARPS